MDTHLKPGARVGAECKEPNIVILPTRFLSSGGAPLPCIVPPQ
jgi:hypothetical protein